MSELPKDGFIRAVEGPETAKITSFLSPESTLHLRNLRAALAAESSETPQP